MISRHSISDRLFVLKLISLLLCISITWHCSLSYHEMISGIARAANEGNLHTPLFQDNFVQTRQQNFKITPHRNFSAKSIHRHIREVAETPRGFSTDRIDRAINAADKRNLLISLAPKTPLLSWLLSFMWVRVSVKRLRDYFRV